jgi:hypothetical protein
LRAAPKLFPNPGSRDTEKKKNKNGGHMRATPKNDEKLLN